MEHLRITAPARHAQLTLLPCFQQGEIIHENITEAQMMFLQRNAAQHFKMFRSVLGIFQNAQKPIVYDLDDFLLGLPENHPDRKSFYYASGLLAIYYALLVADYVTVSTETLKQTLLAYNENIHVLPNYLDDSIWQLHPPVKKEKSAILKLGYMGGETHQPDLEMLIPILQAICNKYPQRVQLHFYGIKPPESLQQYAPVQWTPVKTYDYAAFVADFQTNQFDLVVAPLGDNLFNRCKSHLKYLEYSAMGVPGVYSRLDPYQSIVSDGQNGFLASTAEEWHQKLTLLIEDDEKRHQMAMAAQATLQSQWLMSNHAHEWQDFYTAICQKPIPKKAALPLGLLESITEQLGEFHQLTNEQLVASREKVNLQDHEINTLASKLLEEQTEVQQLSVQLNQLNDQLGERDSHIHQLNDQIDKKDQTIQQMTAAWETSQDELAAYAASQSWRLTRPLRKFMRLIKGSKHA